MSRMTPLYKDIRLNCTIVSDTHIDEKHPMPWLPKLRLKQALADAQRSEKPVDAFITVGDTTSLGSIANWELALDCFKKYRPAENIILTIGNHDAWNDDGYDTAIRNYYSYFEKICGVKQDKPYFSYVINGYHLIFLGNESEAGCEAQIGDGQMKWFAGEMDAGTAGGRPVFVFCHQSLNERHGLPRTWDESEKWDDLSDGGIGDRSGEVAAILKAHRNVFYFSGHSHMGFGGERLLKKEGYASFENEDGVELINLPSLACGNHHGEIRQMGMGAQLEVYDDRVVIRPRSFKRHSWIESVPIRDGKPYLEAPRSAAVNGDH